jgi:hypothetical protein
MSCVTGNAEESRCPGIEIEKPSFQRRHSVRGNERRGLMNRIAAQTSTRGEAAGRFMRLCGGRLRPVRRGSLALLAPGSLS